MDYSDKRNYSSFKSAGLASVQLAARMPLADNRTRVMQLKSTTSPVSSPVIQLAKITVNFNGTGIPMKDLRVEDRSKLNRVIALTRDSLDKVKPKSITGIQIGVQKMHGSNPASTGNYGGIIVVRVAEWFLRMSSVGDIAGMIAHEIGVHTLSDDLLTGGEKTKEDTEHTGSFSTRVNLHTHTIGPWTSRDQDYPRQRDHIIIGRDHGGEVARMKQKKIIPKKRDLRGNKSGKRKVVGEDVVNRRAQEYANTMLRLGDEIEAHRFMSRKEKDRHLHDLLNSFLFDYARILVTDDTPWKVAPKTHLIAQVFNWYKNVIITRHGKAHPWLLRGEMQPTASGWGLRAYLLSKLTRALYDQAMITRPGKFIEGNVIEPVSNLGSRIGGTISHYASPVVAPVVNAVSPFVSPVVNTVGNVVGTTLRAVDTVYGEVENLGQNVVGLGVSTVKGLYKAGKWGLNKLNPFGR